MTRRTRPLALALLLLAPGAFAQEDKWDGPLDLGISEDLCQVTAPGPLQGGFLDEIVHVSLIPVRGRPGQRVQPGDMMIWTRCDIRNPGEPAYRTWLWSPSRGVVAGVPLPVDSQYYGIFCSGQCWVLDADETSVRDGGRKLKLLVAGGRGAFGSASFGSDRTLLFDPEEASWSFGPDLVTAPQEPAFLVGYYYPSVIPYVDAPSFTDRYGVLLFGGSAFPDNEPSRCRTSSPIPQIGPWFSRFVQVPEAEPVWASAGATGDGPLHQYPRVYVLSDGTLLHAGHAVTCESGGDECDPSVLYYDDAQGQNAPAPDTCDLGYGGRSVYGLLGATVADPNDPEHPAAQTLAPRNEALTPGNPEFEPAWADAVAAGRNVGSWHYCNGVILHTLKKSGWTYPVGDPQATPGELRQYDVDRVIVTGGVYKQFPGDQPYWGIQSCLEWDHVTGAWKAKAAPNVPRALGSNLVILPTGELFAVGGSTNSAVADLSVHINQPELFDPAGPDDAGSWTLAKQRPVDTSSGVPTFHPRNYHSCAILMLDGNVAVMGGRQFKGLEGAGLADPRDSVEIYRPSYTAKPSRRPVPQGVPSTLHYQTASDWNRFELKVEDAHDVRHVVLVGAGAVTHHFDYGQRYVELPVAALDATRLEVVPPPSDTLAPPGYYLLFVVTREGIPSDGVPVRVDYES